MMRLIDADELITIDLNGLVFVPKEFIDKAPTVAYRPTATWSEGQMRHLMTGEVRAVRICSACDAGYFKYDLSDGVEGGVPHFCPNCGADMRTEFKGFVPLDNAKLEDADFSLADRIREEETR